jgi:tRNA(Ile)-lysidine synthase
MHCSNVAHAPVLRPIDLAIGRTDIHSAIEPAPAPSEPLVIGYSGGGDSTALLLKLASSGQDVIAAIVDHGLREGSARDAARAAAIAREAGVAAEILTLAWPKGAKPAQQAARRGRMAALAAFARSAGAHAIALAHTRDDQAETVLIRLAAGSSWFGLAGMSAAAPAPLWPEGRGLTLHRPLLGVSRAALRARLQVAGASWIEDPANSQTHYARVRARRRLIEWADAGLGVARWAALADRLAPQAAALDQAARALIDSSIGFEGPAALLDPHGFSGASPDVQRRALAALIVAAGASARPPDEAALDRVLGALEQGRTLGGARLRPRKGLIEIGRDPGGVTGRGGAPGVAPLDLPAGKEVIWDGRLALKAAEPGWRTEPRPGGQSPLLRRGNHLESLEDASKSGAVAVDWVVRERIAHLLWR